MNQLQRGLYLKGFVKVAFGAPEIVKVQFGHAAVKIRLGQVGLNFYHHVEAFDGPGVISKIEAAATGVRHMVGIYLCHTGNSE